MNMFCYSNLYVYVYTCNQFERLNLNSRGDICARRAKRIQETTIQTETEAGPFPPLVKYDQLRNSSHALNSAAAFAEPGTG